MNIRFNADDLKRIEFVKRYYAGLDPVPVRLGTADVVRMGLETLERKLTERKRVRG